MADKAASANWRLLPPIDQAGITADLRRLGIEPGSTLLVHSSLSRIGNVDGGAGTIIDALRDAVGAEGTVLFPTLTGAASDGPNHPPVFDALATGCWTGRIPEIARLRPDAVRSLHPTHSVVAIGPAAERYTTGHEIGTTPCDERSPYYRLIMEHGYLLLLGADHESNTTLHCLEELAEVPYHLQDEVTASHLLDSQGQSVTVRNRLHLWRWERHFGRVDQPLKAAGAQRVGKVGQAPARLVSADLLARTIIPFLWRDPLYLLDDSARAEYLAATVRSR